MALTLTRWIVAALVGCAALAGWALRQTPAEPPKPVNRDAQLLLSLSTARSKVEDEFARLRTVAIRDSLVAHAPSVANGSVVASDHSSRMRFWGRRDIPVLLAGAGAERPVHALVPVEIALVFDTARIDFHRGRMSRELRVEYLLPGSGFNDRCTVLVQDGDFFQGNLPIAPQSLLGPCGYYEAFGTPGPAIDRWLRARGWTFGQRVSRGHAKGWIALIEGKSLGMPKSTIDRLAREALGLDAARCATGDIDQCQRSVLESGVNEFAPVWGDGFMSPRTLVTRAGARHRWLGPADDMLLSEMARTLGPDRFAQFWRSDRDPAQAFRAAAGISLGQWTHDWMVREYGVQTRGPTINRAGFGITGVILLVALAIGFRAVQRRSVG